MAWQTTCESSGCLIEYNRSIFQQHPARKRKDSDSEGIEVPRLIPSRRRKFVSPAVSARYPRGRFIMDFANSGTVPTLR
jgi:hypothetical protein